MTNILTTTDIRDINECAYKLSMTNDAISDLLDIPLEDVEAVLLRRYVADIEFKPADEITLAEYEAIRKRFYPGKQSPSNEYCLAREFGISPDTVLNIARGRFSNALTHPEMYAEPEPVEIVERSTERLMDADDVARVNKLLGWSWPIGDIASELGVDASRINKVKQCRLNRWSVDDALSLVNRGL